MTNTTDAPGPRPAASATKTELVDYAVQRGTDRATADSMTKEQLATHLDQLDQQAGQPSTITGNNPPQQG